MANLNYSDLFSTAKEKFNEGKYKMAETLLQQVLIYNNQMPEVFYMLGTIYYDQGRFNKAIKAYKRALEIDPTFSDASVGLSIILNDLGRYNEGKEVFEQAQKIADEKNKQSDPFIEDQLVKKHIEIGDLYFQSKRYAESLEQYYKALKLTTKKSDVHLKIIDCFIKQGSLKKAIKDLKNLVQDYPTHIPARLKLGVLFYNSKRVAEAVDQWEILLSLDPNNKEAKKYLSLSRQSGMTLLA